MMLCRTLGTKAVANFAAVLRQAPSAAPRNHAGIFASVLPATGVTTPTFTQVAQSVATPTAATWSCIGSVGSTPVSVSACFFSTSSSSTALPASAMSRRQHRAEAKRKRRSRFRYEPGQGIYDPEELAAHKAFSQYSPGVHRSHFKRAASVMERAKRESRKRMTETRLQQRGGKFVKFNVGDAVQVRYSQEVADARPPRIRGVVISKRRKGIDSGFTMINELEQGDLIELTYPYASPLLKEIKVLKSNHVNKGKRVRRAKLYYLRNQLPARWNLKKLMRQQRRARLAD